LASEGFDLVLVARDSEGLDSIAKKLKGQYEVEVWPVSCDLNDPDAIRHIEEVIGERTIHFLVYNAARSYIGAFEPAGLNT
jgi:short-subunit dehydrogenase